MLSAFGPHVGAVLGDQSQIAIGTQGMEALLPYRPFCGRSATRTQPIMPNANRVAAKVQGCRIIAPPPPLPIRKKMLRSSPKIGIEVPSRALQIAPRSPGKAGVQCAGNVPRLVQLGSIETDGGLNA